MKKTAFAKASPNLKSRTIIGIHDSVNELLTQQSLKISGDSFHREMDDYGETQNHPNAAVIYIDRKTITVWLVHKQVENTNVGFPHIFYLWNSLFVLNMSHPYHQWHNTTCPWPNVGFLTGVARNILEKRKLHHFTKACVLNEFPRTKFQRNAGHGHQR